MCTSVKVVETEAMCPLMLDGHTALACLQSSVRFHSPSRDKKESVLRCGSIEFGQFLLCLFSVNTQEVCR